jgi:uncharacterized protein YecE (DUF72 family)
LRDTLDAFPDHIQVAFEPRHDSWYHESTASLLAEHDAAFCLTDTPLRKSPLWRTTSWGYLRLHQGRANPPPCYGRRALDSWAERLAERWEDNATCYVYFNNDHAGCAVRDAHRFANSVRRTGLTPSRVPIAKEASLRLKE